MSSYIELPIETDPQDIMDDLVTFLQGIYPGWTAAPGNLDTWLLQAVALSAAESREVASAVPRSIFRYFGASLVGLAPLDDVAASTTTTWVVQDNLGYTIPAGTQISIAKTGDEVFAFETVIDVVIPPGSTTATGVQVVAVTPGADSSGLGTVGGAAALLDPLSFVTSITLAAATSGGTDAEDDDTYLGRLVGYLQLFAPRPILPQDFAAFARNIAGVARATAIDGYDPNTQTFGNARTITVAAIDDTGNAVSSAIKGQIAADLAARREVNFLVYVVDPQVNLIDVTVNVKLLAGYDPATVAASITAALNNYLSPATWGTTNGTDWNNNLTVRYLEIAQTINEVSGVDYITATGGLSDLQIGIHGGTLARTDVALVGVAPLPDLSTATVTTS